MYQPSILYLMPSQEEVFIQNARVAQLVEHHLAKVEVASSNLVSRSKAVKEIWLSFFVWETSAK